MTVRRPNLRVEKELLRGGVTRLAAMDEVGRGALAGPVTVGVVVVTAAIGRVPAGLADSKLLTPEARDNLVNPVRRWVSEYAVGHAAPQEIDDVGIIAALRMAGRRALAALSEPVDAVLLDGNHDYLSVRTAGAGRDDGPVPFPGCGDSPALFDIVTADAEPTFRVHVRIKADMTCGAVAAASVLAKTERDRLLVDLAPAYPAYGFAGNKGYATPDHMAALSLFGPSAVHRQSWRLPCAHPQLFA